MNEWLLFLVAALAVYRFSKLIAEDEGPWGIFPKLHTIFPEQSNGRRGIECIMCVSMWVAFPVALLVALFGTLDPWLMPLYWLALAGVTVLIRRWEQKR